MTQVRMTTGRVGRAYFAAVLLLIGAAIDVLVTYAVTVHGRELRS